MPSSAAEAHRMARKQPGERRQGSRALVQLQQQDRRGDGGGGRTMGTVSATAGVGKCKEK